VKVVRLYFARGSSSLATRIALLEAGIAFDETEIDEHTKVMAGGGDYRTVNPLGYVPALQLDDGVILTEGSAISQYLADLAPEKKLAPPNGTVARTNMQAWLNFLTGELHKGSLTPLFNPAMPEDAKALFRARAATRLAYLNEHLARHDYLLGEEYSIADAHCFVMLNWLAWVHMDISAYPDLVRFHSRIAARSAVKAALEAEHLIPWPPSPA
jgi:glutathione S-transferase